MIRCGVMCSVHVASVFQMAHMLLTHGGIRQSNAMNMLEVYGTYWSAITHDFEHGGLNNDFLVCNNFSAGFPAWLLHHASRVLMTSCACRFAHITLWPSATTISLPWRTII